MQDTQNNHRLQGHLLGAFSVLVWGTTFVATKVLLRTFSPIEIMIARFALGFLALLIVGRGLMRPQKKWHEALFCGGRTNSGVTLIFSQGKYRATYISASLVGVIVAAAPLFTALIAAVFLKEKLSIWFFCGFVCAMTGITLVSLAGVSELHFSPVGALLTVGAALVWGVYSVLIRVLGHMGYQTVPLTCRIFGYGFLFLLIPTAFEGLPAGIAAWGTPGASGEPAVSRPARVRDLLCDMEPRGLSARSGAHERVHLRFARHHHHRLRAHPARDHDAGDVGRHGARPRRADAEREENKEIMISYSGCAIVGGATGVFLLY